MKKAIFTTIFVCFAFIAKAQAPTNEATANETGSSAATTTQNSNFAFSPRKLTLGGRFGLQFGNYTSINVAPQLGYNFTRHLNAGVGLSYTYYRERYRLEGTKMRDSNKYAGLNIFAKVHPIRNIVLMVQPEVDYMWKHTKNLKTNSIYMEEKFVPVCLVGAGVKFLSISAMLQYDVAQNSNSPYGNSPFYSVGYVFNF